MEEKKNPAAATARFRQEGDKIMSMLLAVNFKPEDLESRIDGAACHEEGEFHRILLSHRILRQKQKT